MDKVLSAIDRASHRIEFLEGELEIQKGNLLNERDKELKLELSLEMNSKAIVLVTSLFERLNERGLSVLDKLIAGALSQVFPHRDYSVHHEVTQERGYNSLNFYLREVKADDRVQVSNIRTSVGGSIRAIAGVVCLAFYLMKMDAEKFIALDEALSQVDDSAVDGLFLLLKSLGEKAGFQFLLVSHDPRFKERFDSIYEVLQNGTLEKVK